MVEPMMTARQVAEVLGVHENWVYDQAVGGDLPSYKIGGARRFQPDEVRGWIAEHREAQRERQARRRTARPMSVTAGEEPSQQASKVAAAAESSGDPQPRLFET